MHSHVQRLVQRYPALDACSSSVDAAASVIVDCFQQGQKLLLAGNGGSAADADHISGELLKGFAKERKLCAEHVDVLGRQLADHLQGGLPAIPLSQFTALLTAYSNDCDAEYACAQLVWSLGAPGDVLIAISTSGNSSNILQAVRVAKKKGMTVVALTGQTGQLLNEVHVAISVPSMVTHEIQEFHLPVYHSICLAVEEAMFSDDISDDVLRYVDERRVA